MIQDEAVIGGGIMCKRNRGATFYDLQFFKKKNPEPAVINGNASGVPKNAYSTTRGHQLQGGAYQIHICGCLHIEPLLNRPLRRLFLLIPVSPSFSLCACSFWAFQSPCRFLQHLCRILQLLCRALQPLCSALQWPCRRLQWAAM